MQETNHANRTARQLVDDKVARPRYFSNPRADSMSSHSQVHSSHFWPQVGASAGPSMQRLARDESKHRSDEPRVSISRSSTKNVHETIRALKRCQLAQRPRQEYGESREPTSDAL